MNVIKCFNISEKTELRKISDSIAKFKEISLSNISETQRNSMIEEAMLFYLTAKLFSEKIKAKEIKSKNRDGWKDNSYFFKSYLLENVSRECFLASLSRINELLAEEELLSSQTSEETGAIMLKHLGKLANIMYELLKIRKVHDNVVKQKRHYRSHRHTLQMSTI